jgi:hypothetical protein
MSPSVKLESGIPPADVVSLFAIAYGPFKVVLVYKPYITRKFFTALLLSTYNSVVVFLKLDE